MKNIGKVLQVGFTYIGTIVGAGFATGQEILQFFTKYGWMATLTIALSTFVFIWLGTKLMLLAQTIGAKSYEDLNHHLFGKTLGRWISLFILVILFGITTVMLAGAGSVFHEYLQLPMQIGLLSTLFISYFIIVNGIDAILAVNSVVVPIMLLFTAIVVWSATDSPSAGNWLSRSSDYAIGSIWSAPILYAAFNLTLAQAVLVPIGAAMQERSILIYGGIIGGVGIGLMLMAGHFALSANMPGIAQFDIPMGNLIRHFGQWVQLLFIFVIYAEIFTTFIANIYGLALQIHQGTKLNQRMIIIILLISCYGVSQIGFKELLSTLYPLFGWVSLIWLVLILWKRNPA